MRLEDLPLVEFEDLAETLGDFGTGVGLDLETNCVTPTTVVEFGTDRLEQVARLFFLHVEVAVPSNAERSLGNDVVAAIHAGRVQLDEIGEGDVVVGTFLAG